MNARPNIIVVDDEPTALASLLDALTRRYGADYRVIPHLSALGALSELERLKNEGERVALIIADQWMPEMTGSDLLVHAHRQGRKHPPDTAERIETRVRCQEPPEGTGTTSAKVIRPYSSVECRLIQGE